MFLEPKQVEFFETPTGFNPYEHWLDSLPDPTVQCRIMIRTLDLATGTSDEWRDAGGGVWKVVMDFGAGYRIYFGKPNVNQILVLGGGTVETELLDTAVARKHWVEFHAYKERSLWILHATQN